MIKPIKAVMATLIVTSLVCLPIAHGQQKESPEEKAYKFRHSLFQTFSWKLGQLVGAQMASDAAAFNKHANDLLVLSKMTGEGFAIENSLPEGTRAKPEIWEDAEGFAEKSDMLVQAVAGLTEDGAMESFNVREFATKSCGGCHRDFRTKK